VDLIERIRTDTRNALQEGGENEAGERDDLSLEYLTDDEVYALLANARPPSADQFEEQTQEREGVAESLQIIYGSNVFFVGNAVYFYYVNQANNYQCTSSAMRWPYANGSQLVRRCSSNGRWIYQLLRWI
jgi:hypothetical protein